MSSVALFERLALGRSVDPFHYPHDIDDFQRCERLLRSVPELRSRLPMMASVSPQWRSLIEAWDAICVALDEDAPGLLSHGWKAIPYGQRERASKRASALFEAAYERGYAAYRAEREQGKSD